MKKKIFMICLLLMFGLCGLVLAADKAIGLQRAGLTTTTGGQKWALVVGINEYSNVPALQYASAAAKGLYNALIRAGFPADNIMLMTDTSTGPMLPTRGNLRARINQIATLVDKDDVLLFFFSGHGMAKNGEGYLVPIDGSATDIGSLIPLSWVKTTLETSSAKHRLLILDACHSGAKSGDATASPARAMLSNLVGAAFVTLSSCDTDQLSYEDKESGHGIFTSAIIEGTSGAADKQAQGNNDIVNAIKLWAYVALKTKQCGMKSGKVQILVLRCSSIGLIEIAIFKSFKALNAQKDKLRKELKMMEEINRNNAAQKRRKEIAKRNIASRRPRRRTSKHETALKYQADAIMYVALQSQIDAKQAQYDELTKELLPSAPQVVKVEDEITKIQKKQQLYEIGYISTYPPDAGAVIINSIGMKLIWIPAGEFAMGSPLSESKRRSDEGPVHKVVITKGFWMSQTEVTQAQYRAIMGENPSKFKGDNNPVERVRWNDATEFCRKLSQKEGKTYKLPTEAQWEYACRAGSTTAYSFGDSESSLGDYAWYDGNSGGKTHPVGQKKPNAFGLYDMHGNVWEWCQDRYDKNYYYNGDVEDPVNRQKTGNFVFRGGSWGFYPWLCRSALRLRIYPLHYCIKSTALSYDLGFRVVCVSPLRN